VIRGGSWVDHAADCRASFRYGFVSAHRNNDLGFRLAAIPSGE
jgi:formylglycine-generating enzyme required for sulfatase activity